MGNYNLLIGTCSWKYDSWQGIIYPEEKPFNYLQEYSRHYRTVEIDQWFWSLFDEDRPVLPKPSVVQDYADSVPEDFTFSIKIPNSITLTHYHKKSKSGSLAPNPHFLSTGLMREFLKRIDPISKNIGSLNFQFEYLNKHNRSPPPHFRTIRSPHIANYSSAACLNETGALVERLQVRVIRMSIAFR